MGRKTRKIHWVSKNRQSLRRWVISKMLWRSWRSSWPNGGTEKHYVSNSGRQLQLTLFVIAYETHFAKCFLESVEDCQSLRNTIQIQWMEEGSTWNIITWKACELWKHKMRERPQTNFNLTGFVHDNSIDWNLVQEFSKKFIWKLKSCGTSNKDQ
jgi:hypothetical protein